jgi:hypothetical protein
VSPSKLLFGGLLGLACGIVGLWLTVEGMFRHEAMTFSRHVGWFSQFDRPADFVASVLLHGSLSVVAIVASVVAIGRYFYLFEDPNRLLTSAFVGFTISVVILFFACYSIFSVVGFPVLMALGYPIAKTLEDLVSPSLFFSALRQVEKSQSILALAYISGFLAWWVIASVWASIRLRRLENE